MSLNEMRNGIYSTCPETQLQHYLRYLDTMSEIFEVWTLPTANGLQSVYCKTTLIDTEDCGCLLLFEAVLAGAKSVDSYRLPPLPAA